MAENITVNLGKVVITPKGNYSTEAQYVILDLVGFGGSSYLALKASKNIPVTNTEFWMLIAEKGESIEDVQWTEEKHLVITLSTGQEIEITEFAEALTNMESATSAATSAASSANSATTAATNAATSATNAATAANTAADSATSASTAASESASAASAAASTANTAASNANAKASLANEKAALANEKASLANTKAEAAQTAANNANNAANSATTAAGAANTAASSATNAATAATTAAGSATSAATSANTAASNANAKATLAQEAADAADAAREAIQDDLAAKADKSYVDEADEAQSSRIAQLETGKASKASLAETDYKATAALKWLEGIAYDVETDDDEAYSKTIKSGVVAPANKATVQMIGAKSYVKNNKVLFAGRTHRGATFTVSDNGKITANGTATGGNAYVEKFLSENLVGHKILISCPIAEQGQYSTFFNNGSFNLTEPTVVTLAGTGHWVRCGINEGNTANNWTYEFVYIDLTQWFNGDSTILNSITTPEDAYALGVPRTYIPYNAGEVISADCDKVVSEGNNRINPSVFFDSEIWTDNHDGTYSSTSIIIGTKDLSDGIIFDANTAYSVVWKGKVSGAASRITIEYTDGTKEYYKAIIDSKTEETLSYYTTNPTKTVKRIIYDYSGSHILTLSYFGIMKGTHTNTVPYMSDSMLIPDRLREDYPLYSNGEDVYDDYTFEKDEQWKELHHKRINTITYDGTEEGWNVTDSGLETQLFVTPALEIPWNAGERSNVRILANGYNFVKWDNKPWTNNMSVSYYINNGSSYTFRIKNDNFSTLEQFKAYLSTNPVTIHYSVDVVETDVTEYFQEGFNPLIDVESGGTVTFHQVDSEFPVPNSISYMRKLSEVAS